MTVPAAEILLIDADESSIREYFVEERFAVISRLDYYDELDSSKTVIQEDALQRGILHQAEENAYGLIQTIFRSAGYDQVEIVRVSP